MSAKKKTASSAPNDYRIKATSGWAGAWKIFAGIGGIGLAGAGFGYTMDPKRAAFSYLFAFFTFLAIAMGALFFVLVQHLTKAGWSVTVRRTAEFFMKGLWVLALLAIPIVIFRGQLFPWVAAENAPAHGEHAAVEPTAGEHGKATDEQGATAPALGHPAVPGAEEHGAGGVSGAEENQEKALEAAHHEEEAHILAGKKPFLNTTFFIIRALLYAIIWFFLSNRLFKLSTDQDTSKRLEYTSAAQKFAPLATMLFALSLTFAGVDWLMALNPVWYSTIFGVYIFACSVVSSLATLILTTLLMKRSGLIKDEINVEHYHDLGKLLFGFLVFWAYISFSQFFLIWYSNIPEELVFYHKRWAEGGGSWKTFSASLVIVHFAFPFWLLMSRNVKRRVQGLTLGAITLLVMHVVEMYWIVMPNLGNGVFAPHWIDVAALVGVGGVYLAVVLRTMASHSLIPIGDPRLARALKFENA